MYDSSLVDIKKNYGVVLEKIDEETQTLNTNVELNGKGVAKRRSRRGKEERILWLRNSSSSFSKQDDSSTGSSCYVEDSSTSSYGSSLILEVPPILPTSQSGLNEKLEKTSRKKSVRFACDENGNVLSDMLEFKKISKRSHGKVWWTEEELGSFRVSCIEVVQKFQRNDIYLWAVSILYPNGASLKTLKSVDKRKDHKRKKTRSQQDADQSYENSAEFELARQILLENGEARGLEIHISPVTHQTTGRHQRSVLKKRSIPCTPSELRRKSKAHSKASAMFASKMAQLDQHLARLS